MTCDCQAQVLLALGGIIESVRDLNRKVETIMTQQDDLNADVATLTTALGDVASQTSAAVSAIAAVQAEITSLQNANPSLDLSSLDQLASTAATTTGGLDAAVGQLTALVPPAVSPAAGDGTQPS